MASPPFNIAETTPQSSDVVLNYPAVERTYRDVVESWLTVHSDPATGLIKWAGIAPVAQIPIGAEISFAGPTAPTGWLLEFGQSLLRADYAALFAVIGTTYGSVDGTHFTLPDKRGRTTAGKDDMGGPSANRLTNPAGTTGGIDGDVLGGTGGLETHALTSTQNGPHVHTGTTATGSANHVHTVASAQDPSHAGGDAAVEGNSDGGSIPTTASGLAHTHTFTTDSGGSGTGHNNVQPTIISNMIIYAGV